MLLGVTVKPKTLFTIIGIACILAPWVYALIAFKMDPNSGRDGGVFELATYASFITFPVGVGLIVLGLIRRKQ